MTIKSETRAGRALCKSIALFVTSGLAGAFALGPASAQRPLLSEEPLAIDDMVLARRASEANDPAEALARYLRVLAREPRDLEALTGAGKASLDIGDANAAISFYARAEEIEPRNGRIKAGLASAMVQLVQPKIALKLFDEAVSYGVPVADIASDRGLAYALRGDSKHARADYQLALAAHPDPETTRRLALTQAIDGDSVSAMATLDSLLRKQDKAAWRDRVFIQALSGDVSGAQKIADAMLQRDQAAALQPFLVRLAKLRPSQQAAAVHFGQFPSDGRQYSEAELFAAAGSSPPPEIPVVTRPRATSSSSDEQGDGIDEQTEPSSGGRQRQGRNKAADRASADSEVARSSGVLTASKPDVIAQTRFATSAFKPNASEHKMDAKDSESPDKKTPAARTTDKQDARNPAKDSKRKESAEAKTDRDKKDRDKKLAKTEPKTTPAKSKNPERYWVQIATGSYRPDLGKEWTRLKGKYPALLGHRSAWTTPLNRTNRLLVGPFKTGDEAQSFVNKTTGAGFVTSPFTSSAGQSVDPVSP